ncbi:MAG: bifunctional adenosylcobinamide kinase/adenosylcobinamide-phosphate guanylyltransferase [Desulfobulbaceae bacterium]|nr:bifunctional adenosylcobinamide kinase/adenosylcobinamide-phosphate guanylyltransferase [Desulfobulbaceae bacterium]
MAKIILATGGARSGKSAYAQNFAESLPGSKAFIATCPAPTGDDEEMLIRVERHRQDRLGADWLTIEEEVDLKSVLEGNLQVETMLIDCLTLWISNLMYAYPQIDEKAITERVEQLIAACRNRSGTVIFVTNEVGCGIVPEHASARKFRDLSGRCNQIIAKVADEVIFFSCGLPLFLKQSPA